MKHWLTRLSIIFGLLSTVALCGSFSGIFLQSIDPVLRTGLVRWILPGLILAVLGIVMGIIAYRKTRARIACWGIAVGIVTIAAFFVLEITAGGRLPFNCIINLQACLPSPYNPNFTNQAEMKALEYCKTHSPCAPLVP
ncbi:MAG TPA: hypothetical protein VNG29_01055 [Candidatus Paceibacterota bacterium]|nr:hypothetical protein [Candidatus Paceibacterota bacterium]